MGVTVSLEYSTYPYKMNVLILSTLLVLSSGGRLPRAGDHHGDGHDDNCVDISKYGPVQYNETRADVCTYKTVTECTPRSQEVCVTVPITECEVVGYTDCQNTPTTSIVKDDSLETHQFVKQDCVVSDEKEIITEMKKMPVCRNVTKQQCDTKWVVNDQGEKVWAGNENCQEVTWEDCTLEDRVITQEVDVWECNPSPDPIFYQTLVESSVDVTTYDMVCQPRANPVCSHSAEVQCKTVEWEDCTDIIIPSCFNTYFKVPYQEYDHRLRCSVGH